MSARERLTPGLLAALGFLAGIGPLATDMYLSSFTDIARELGTSASGVQLTMAGFMVGLGAGQLIIGPLSDRFGRRPVLLISLAVLAASAVAMVFSVSIEMFVALRFVEGLFGAGGVVICRAIAADLSTGETAVRALSVIAMVGATGSLIAPPLGAAVSVVGGWRAVLAAIAAFMIAMLVVSLVVVPESLPPAARQTGGVGALGRMLGTAVAAPGFVAYGLVFTGGFATMILYISASPFVGQSVLGMPPMGYALGYAIGGAALVAANLLNARVATRVGPTRMLTVGVGLQLTAGVLFTALVLAGLLSPWTFIVTAIFLTSGTGLVMANASALALARTPTVRGSGAALIGGTQFAVGGFIAPLPGLWGEHTALPMALSILATAAVLTACRLFARRYEVGRSI